MILNCGAESFPAILIALRVGKGIGTAFAPDLIAERSYDVLTEVVVVRDRWKLVNYQVLSVVGRSNVLMILTVPRHPLIVRRAPVLPNGIADYLHQRIEFDGTSGLTRTASALTALEIGEVVFSHPAKARIFQTPKADAHAVSESPTLFVLFDDPIIFAPP